MDEQEDLSVCRDCGGKSSHGFCHDCFTCSDCPCIAGCQCDNCRYNDDVDKLVWDKPLAAQEGTCKNHKTNARFWRLSASRGYMGSGRAWLQLWQAFCACWLTGELQDDIQEAD